jgi:3-oxoacyl-[acyl-carrier protein] reductase
MEESMTLEGKFSLVVGGARGLGRATALTFGREGSNVVLADILADRVVETAKEVEAAGVKALGVGCDVSDEDQVAALVKRCIDEFGQIDVMVNTVAWIDTPDFIVNLSREMFEKTLLYDLTTHFLVAKHVVRAMLPRQSGRIINISSAAGLRGSSMRVAYCVAKAGVIMLSETLDAEYGDKGIIVNALCPTGIAGERLDALMQLYTEQRAKNGIQQPQVQQGPAANSSRAIPGTMEPSELAEYILFLADEAPAEVKGRGLTMQEVHMMMEAAGVAPQRA